MGLALRHDSLHGQVWRSGRTVRRKRRSALSIPPSSTRPGIQGRITRHVPRARSSCLPCAAHVSIAGNTRDITRSTCVTGMSTRRAGLVGRLRQSQRHVETLAAHGPTELRASCSRISRGSWSVAAAQSSCCCHWQPGPGAGKTDDDPNLDSGLVCAVAGAIGSQ